MRVLLFRGCIGSRLRAPFEFKTTVLVQNGDVREVCSARGCVLAEPLPLPQ